MNLKKSSLSSTDLQKKLYKIQKKSNSKLLEVLEELKIDYCVLSMEDYDYFRVRVNLSCERKDYGYSDIYFSNYEKCYIVRNYFMREV